ncbi:MAG: cob(I)yrinic acid a,c-diamide adenosyltransferase [Candidatus Diapherotrites archaeon]|nr:cob(I)yrinic acid a,c-diamide adenosyltransferase [Candidatus Diapherotrites archaeon]
MGADKPFLERGMVHVYTGDGKGKTTASLGLAFRAMGYGMKVYMVQFLKIGYTGEALALRRFGLPMSLESFNVTCKNQASHDADIAAGVFSGYCRDCFVPTQYDAPMAEKAFLKGKEAVDSGKYDLVIFDELNVALNMKLLSVSTVLEMLAAKPPHTEIVLTGRNAPAEVIGVADYVTRMELHRHPYMKKIYARKGIEF